MDYSNNSNSKVFPKGIKVDPLANAKGVQKLCELCKQPARLQCSQCKITFYCNENHQKLDWSGIHMQICEMLLPLRTPLAPPTSEQERLLRCEQIQYGQKQLIEVCRSVSEQRIIEQQFNDSIPACLQLLKSSISLYGGNSVQLVQAYLLLGQASIGLEKFDQAEEYLCQAQWIVSKSESCSIEIKFKLAKSLGALYNARRHWQFAIKEYSDMVYYAYELYGIDSIQIASGYFYLASVLLNQDKNLEAISLYKQAIEIWHNELRSIFSNNDFSLKNHKYDDTLMLETKDILIKISIISCKYAENFVQDMPRIFHCLTCINIIFNDLEKAKEHHKNAIESCQSISYVNDSNYLVYLRKFAQDNQLI